MGVRIANGEIGVWIGERMNEKLVGMESVWEKHHSFRKNRENRNGIA